VLDHLNNFLRHEGLCFGPDVATSARATLGGMIANNSSGAHAPLYGTTADHISELEIVLGDGRVFEGRAGHETLPKQRELMGNMAMFNSLEITEHCQPGLVKRWPGYALDRAVREPDNLIHVLAGSEGTLAAIISAELQLVPTPDEIGVGLIFFDSIAEAMQATTELLDLKPAAIEHIDRVLLDQTKGQRNLKSPAACLTWTRSPASRCWSWSFMAMSRIGSPRWSGRALAGGKKSCRRSPTSITSGRCARRGLSLLTGRAGDAKPVTCIEDAAVRPKDLPAYYNALKTLIARLGLQASYYGHAASGLLHVRPVLDLHLAADLKKFREVAEEVASLVRQFKGSLAGEHGVGIARTEFLKDHVGEEMHSLMRQIKKSFDPHNLFNPGKIISDDRYQIDTNLRLGAGYALKLPFEPGASVRGQGRIVRAEISKQCNGCGGCLKHTPTMCPTFIATGEEIMSTRGPRERDSRGARVARHQG